MGGWNDLIVFVFFVSISIMKKRGSRSRRGAKVNRTIRKNMKNRKNRENRTHRKMKGGAVTPPGSPPPELRTHPESNRTFLRQASDGKLHVVLEPAPAASANINAAREMSRDFTFKDVMPSHRLRRMVDGVRNKKNLYTKLNENGVIQYGPIDLEEWIGAVRPETAVNFTVYFSGPVTTSGTGVFTGFNILIDLVRGAPCKVFQLDVGVDDKGGVISDKNAYAYISDTDELSTHLAHYGSLVKSRPANWIKESADRYTIDLTTGGANTPLARELVKKNKYDPHKLTAKKKEILERIRNSHSVATHEQSLQKYVPLLTFLGDKGVSAAATISKVVESSEKYGFMFKHSVPIAEFIEKGGAILSDREHATVHQPLINCLDEIGSLKMELANVRLKFLRLEAPTVNVFTEPQNDDDLDFSQPPGKFAVATRSRGPSMMTRGGNPFAIVKARVDGLHPDKTGYTLNWKFQDTSLYEKLEGKDFTPANETRIGRSQMRAGNQLIQFIATVIAFFERLRLDNYQHKNFVIDTQEQVQTESSKWVEVEGVLQPETVKKFAKERLADSGAEEQARIMIEDSDGKGAYLILCFIKQFDILGGPSRYPYDGHLYIPAPASSDEHDKEMLSWLKRFVIGVLVDGYSQMERDFDGEIAVLRDLQTNLDQGQELNGPTTEGTSQVAAASVDITDERIVTADDRGEVEDTAPVQEASAAAVEQREEEALPPKGDVQGTSWKIGYQSASDWLQGGEPWFYNKDTKESQWDMPDEVKHALATEGTSQVAAEAGIQLIATADGVKQEQQAQAAVVSAAAGIGATASAFSKDNLNTIFDLPETWFWITKSEVTRDSLANIDAYTRDNYNQLLSTEAHYNDLAERAKRDSDMQMYRKKALDEQLKLHVKKYKTCTQTYLREQFAENGSFASVPPPTREQIVGIVDGCVDHCMEQKKVSAHTTTGDPMYHQAYNEQQIEESQRESERHVRTATDADAKAAKAAKSAVEMETGTTVVSHPELTPVADRKLRDWFTIVPQQVWQPGGTLSLKIPTGGLARVKVPDVTELAEPVYINPIQKILLPEGWAPIYISVDGTTRYRNTLARRPGIGHMSKSNLKDRAINCGAATEAVEKAMNGDQPKEDLIKLIRGLPGGGTLPQKKIPQRSAWRSVSRNDMPPATLDKLNQKSKAESNSNFAKDADRRKTAMDADALKAVTDSLSDNNTPAHGNTLIASKHPIQLVDNRNDQWNKAYPAIELKTNWKGDIKDQSLSEDPQHTLLTIYAKVTQKFKTVKWDDDKTVLWENVDAPLKVETLGKLIQRCKDVEYAFPSANTGNDYLNRIKELLDKIRTALESMNIGDLFTKSIDELVMIYLEWKSGGTKYRTFVPVALLHEVNKQGQGAAASKSSGKIGGGKKTHRKPHKQRKNHPKTHRKKSRRTSRR